MKTRFESQVIVRLLSSYIGFSILIKSDPDQVGDVQRADRHFFSPGEQDNGALYLCRSKNSLPLSVISHTPRGELEESNPSLTMAARAH